MLRSGSKANVCTDQVGDFVKSASECEAAANSALGWLLCQQVRKIKIAAESLPPFCFVYAFSKGVFLKGQIFFFFSSGVPGVPERLRYDPNRGSPLPKASRSSFVK